MAGAAIPQGNFNLADIAPELACADFGLLPMLKRSAEYARIRKQVADPRPVDAWQFDMLHYFLFKMRPVENNDEVYSLFTMRWEDDDPVAAVIITPSADGTGADITNLKTPDNKSETIPLPPPAASQSL